jgi:hypothetical protein
MHTSAALRVGAVCGSAVRATIAPGRGQGPLSPHDVQGLGEARRATSAYIERRASSCREGRKIWRIRSNNGPEQSGWRDSNPRPPAPKSVPSGRWTWLNVVQYGVHLGQRSPEVAWRSSVTVHVGSHFGSQSGSGAGAQRAGPYGFAAARWECYDGRHFHVAGSNLGDGRFIPALLLAPRGARKDAGTATAAPSGPSGGPRTPWTGSHRRGRRRRPRPPPRGRDER